MIVGGDDVDHRSAKGLARTTIALWFPCEGPAGTDASGLLQPHGALTKGEAIMAKRSTKAARDNRANQLNPKHDAYWSSRGANAGAGGALDGQQPEPSTSPQESATGKGDGK